MDGHSVTETVKIKVTKLILFDSVVHALHELTTVHVLKSSCV